MLVEQIIQLPSQFNPAIFKDSYNSWKHLPPDFSEYFEKARNSKI